MLRAYKTELAPNDRQCTLFGRCAGAARYVYNWGLAEWKRQYEAGGKPSVYGLRRQFNAAKDGMCPWVRELPYAVTEAAFQDLGRAFQNFFRRCKNGADKPGYPRFKSRQRSRAGFALRNMTIRPDRVRLTGAGWVRLKERGYIPTEVIKYGTYTRISERAGRWFVSVQAEIEAPEPELRTALVLGIDLGLKSRAVLSNGEVLDAPKALELHQAKRSRVAREMARRTKGSANWCKTRDKLRRVEAKVADTRKHWLHQISHHVVYDLRPETVVLENLNVSGMVKNRHLSKAVSDAGFYELRRQIEYKAAWTGTEVVIADRWYPSSKLCRHCGTINDNLTLSDREWRCDCGAILDRDLNAALNLAALVERRNTPGLPVELGCGEVLL